ncbi:galectin-7-like [Wyeomyia smithii]|uniref:galectin-7-like n=1 Tax=Wyeomyia smithii TaxID=174621 RepID=UPI002467FE55|nr:galectin-7-like [Wyeomyia smithii]XP_055528514.1 galectin-7-like [Wyeomyia smithii]XP_055528515.1 galectin-7-like [Wyeomyia smithii]
MITVHVKKTGFRGLVPGGFFAGSLIRTNGEIKADSWCHIDLLSGTEGSPDGDIPMHISIRPDLNQIVRNTYENQVWGTEETDGGCPIKHGQPFELLILVMANIFRIAINGTHFTDFRHRMPLRSIRYVQLTSGCSIQSLKTQFEYYCVPAPPYPASEIYRNFGRKSDLDFPVLPVSLNNRTAAPGDLAYSGGSSLNSSGLFNHVLFFFYILGKNYFLLLGMQTIKRVTTIPMSFYLSLKPIS